MDCTEDRRTDTDGPTEAESPANLRRRKVQPPTTVPEKPLADASVKTDGHMPTEPPKPKLVKPPSRPNSAAGKKKRKKAFKGLSYSFGNKAKKKKRPKIDDTSVSSIDLGSSIFPSLVSKVF